MLQMMTHSSNALASLTEMNKLQTTHTERLVVGEHRHTETLAGLDVNKTIVNQAQHQNTTMEGVHRNISQLAANHLPTLGCTEDNSRSQGSTLTWGRSQSRETFIGSPPDGLTRPTTHDSGFGFHAMPQQLQQPQQVQQLQQLQQPRQVQQPQLGLQSPPENLAIESSQDYDVPSQVLQQEGNKMLQDVQKPNPNPNPNLIIMTYSPPHYHDI